MSEWGVLLNGVYLSGGDGTQLQDIQDTDACSALDAEELGCLNAPPEGLGLPGLRTSDATFAGRDGVQHFRDFYEPRIITLAATISADTCPDCPTVREKYQQVLKAWDRHCEDTELVIYTDCHGTEPPTGGTGAITGPYGVIGRPRSAEISRQQGQSKHINLTLRFDAVDHRMYVLDECGTPGSGEDCVTLLPTITGNCRNYERCYTTDLGSDQASGWCYDVERESQSGNMADADVTGTDCSCAIITLSGQLTDVRIENVTTGDIIGYRGVLGSGETDVVIDGSDGTATQGNADRTFRVTGGPTFCLQPGINEIRMTSFGASDDGEADICWRNVVVMA